MSREEVVTVLDMPDDSSHSVTSREVEYIFFSKNKIMWSTLPTVAFDSNATVSFFITDNHRIIKRNKMIRIALIATFFCVHICSLSAQNLYNEINSLFRMYDTTVVLNASLNLERFGNTIGTIKRNSDLYDNALNSVFLSSSNRVPIIIEMINSYLNRFDKERRKLYWSELRELCEIYYTLNYPLRNNETVSFDEVIYKVDASRFLFKKYRTNKTQSWESLSTYQSNSLFYDFMNFMIKMDQKQRIVYYSKYFQKCGELLSNMKIKSEPSK